MSPRHGLLVPLRKSFQKFRGREQLRPAALARPKFGSSFLCILGELDPVGGKSQPMLLFELADRPLGLLAAFLCFLAESICIGIGHGDRDNAEK